VDVRGVDLVRGRISRVVTVEAHPQKDQNPKQHDRNQIVSEPLEIHGKAIANQMDFTTSVNRLEAVRYFGEIAIVVTTAGRATGFPISRTVSERRVEGEARSKPIRMSQESFGQVGINPAHDGFGDFPFATGKMESDVAGFIE